jgi:hypothetical protein
MFSCYLRKYLSLLIIAVLIMTCASLTATGAAVEVGRYTVPALPYRAVIADFDSNGWPDIAVVSKYSDVTVFFNPAKIDQRRTLTLKAYFQPISLAIGDINGDGIADIIPATETLIGPIYFSDGKGNFQKTDLKLYTPPYASFIEAVDLNNDRFDDLVVTGMGGEGPYVYLNKQNGSFDTVIVKLRGQKSGTEKSVQDEYKDVRFISHQAAFLDINSDGIKEILITDELRGSLWLIQEKEKSFIPLEIFHEKDVIAKSVAAFSEQNIKLILLGTIKAGRTDLIFFAGNSRPFPITKRILAKDIINHIEIYDMDNDRQREIICLILRNGQSFVAIYKDDNFDVPVYEFPVSAPISFTIADIDRDGFNDLIIPDYRDNTLSIVYSPLKKK